MVRTGIGYDVHRLSAGETLIIGGVTIPSDKGSVGHSDGDVLTHAVVDALLGSAALGDIGTHFPISNERWKGVSSLTFLSHVVELVNEAGFVITNVDGTVILESPRLSEYLHSMRQTLSSEMGLDTQNFSVKATTTDGLGFTGSGEGVGAVAIATLKRPDS